MSPHALDKTGTRHTDTQWKVKGGREQKLLNAPHIQLLLPAPLMNKPYGPEHEEFHACASILIPLTNWLQTLLVVYLVKLRLTSLIIIDIYPGISTHPKVVFREVLHPIKLKFRNVDFWGEGKTEEPGEKPLGAEERNNNQLTVVIRL